MQSIQKFIEQLELLAPQIYQESYDNGGLLIGDQHQICQGILVCLDITPKIIQEAIQKQCNLIVSHHPIIFNGLKKIDFQTQIGKMINMAIKNDINIYAIHTNLDNVDAGVNDYFSKKLGLVDMQILKPQKKRLKKLSTFVPLLQFEQIQKALFEAGAGKIGNYSECGFSIEGEGSFKPNQEAQPFVGEKEKRHIEKEKKLEVVFSVEIENNVIQALCKNHPYEEPAFDIISLDNVYNKVGSGKMGVLKQALPLPQFLILLKTQMNLKIIKYSGSSENKMIQKVAICGGSGSFLIPDATAANADVFITSDIKYHDYFLNHTEMTLMDIGHFESEQFTIDLIYDYLIKKNPKFAIFKTCINTNPVAYYF